MPCLSESDRRTILELARRAVIEIVSKQRILEDVPYQGILDEPCGVFVTVRVSGKLHGCIGVIQPREKLGESIVRCATGAAVEDPRFRPMQTEELAGLEVEVSLLSPLRPIGPEEIEVGKHGLLVEQGTHHGLLLPQVATEHHLNREGFLRETCHKAGLRPDAWKSPETRLFGFTCEILTEETR